MSLRNTQQTETEEAQEVIVREWCLERVGVHAVDVKTISLM